MNTVLIAIVLPVKVIMSILIEGEGKTEVLRLAKGLYKKLKKFFGVDIAKIDIKIVENVNDFSKARGIKINDIPSYTVGTAKGLNCIIIFSKGKFKERGHKEEEFESVLFHEMAHLFVRSITKRPIDPWIEEGICEYISFKKLEGKPKRLIDFKKIKTPKDWYKYAPYLQSKLFFDYLVKRGGIKKIRELLKNLSKEKTEICFLKVYGSSLGDIQKKWKNYITPQFHVKEQKLKR